MGNKLGVSLGYGIVFLAYAGILFLLTGFAMPGAWIGLGCTVLVLSLCIAAVWWNAFQVEVAHLRMMLSIILTIFFVLQLVAGAALCFLPIRWGIGLEAILLTVCVLGAGCMLVSGRMIAGREQENNARWASTQKKAEREDA